MRWQTIARWIVAALVAPPILLILALAAGAQDTAAWGAEDGLPSVARLEATQAPGAVAQVSFYNDNRHSLRHRVDLTRDGLVVTFELFMDWEGADHGPHGKPDRVVIHPPDGYFADPPEAIVPERAGQVFLIYPLATVGF